MNGNVLTPIFSQQMGTFLVFLAILTSFSINILTETGFVSNAPNCLIKEIKLNRPSFLIKSHPYFKHFLVNCRLLAFFKIHHLEIPKSPT